MKPDAEEELPKDGQLPSAEEVPTDGQLPSAEEVPTDGQLYAEVEPAAEEPTVGNSPQAAPRAPTYRRISRTEARSTAPETL